MANEPIAQTIPKRPTKMTSTQSLNHLLNFTLPPRQTHPQSFPRRGKKSSSHGAWNKESECPLLLVSFNIRMTSHSGFVNAQYRFVMNPTGDYTVHFADPDIFFQWQDILQVIIPRTSAFALTTPANGEVPGRDEGLTTCPICLSFPVAPRMTKCGHVFCFHCILHYLSTSDTIKWARCPICFDSINEKQLKSVKWYEPQAEGDERLTPSTSTSPSTQDVDEAPSSTNSLIRMRLIQRPQITTLALPRSPTWPSELLSPHQAPFHFLPDVYNFARFMLATPEYLIADLSKDLDALDMERRDLAAINDEISILFVDAAMDKLRHLMLKTSALESPQLTSAIAKARTQCEELGRRHSIIVGRSETRDASASALSDAPDAFLSVQPLPNRVTSWATTSTPYITASPGSENPLSSRNHRQRRNLNPPPPSTQAYYYYQAASGLPVFLHPLDIKVLFSHFSSYASFPDEITIRVESAAEGSVNDDLRKRCKYLAHMPEGADVVFVEADLEGVVGKEGLKNFEGALKMRTARRKEKGRRDDRARARAEEKAKERERLLSREPPATLNSGTMAPPPTIEVEEVPRLDPVPQSTSGAWGSRSFAAALHSSPALRQTSGNRNATPEVDEWDLDAAWHEFEQQNGGRKKRGSKLVLLGGVGGRRR
ncbi:hypothetical protein V8B97DRAFT_637456 [Scleroderma yunnanense]